MKRLKTGLAAAGVVAVAVLIGATANEVGSPVTLSAATYSGAGACRSCHEDHFTSWQKTFHRTMTQAATPASVLGDFGNARFTFDGVTSSFSRSGDQFVMETANSDHALQRYVIDRTVGWADLSALPLDARWRPEGHDRAGDARACRM